MTISVDLPEHLYRKAKDIADSQDSSVGEVIASAFAEHVVIRERLKKRAARGEREVFLSVLDKVPDVEPEDYDRM